jgi:hypothetical protein
MTSYSVPAFEDHTAWLPLYRFDDGYIIARAISPMVLTQAWYHLNDWERIESGTLVILGLFDSRGVGNGLVSSLRVVGLDAPTSQPWNMINAYFNWISEKDALKYWWSFAHEMLFPRDQAPQGRWHHTFKVPIIYSDVVNERMKDCPEKRDYDTALQRITDWYLAGKAGFRTRRDIVALQILRENAKKKAYRFAEAVFKGIYSTVELPSESLLLVTLPSINLPIQLKWVGSSQKYPGLWEVHTDQPVSHSQDDIISTAAALRDAWRQMKIRYHGPMLTAEEAEDWEVALGEPVFDIDIYRALEAGTPILWSHDKFMAWYESMQELHPTVMGEAHVP